jgi:hypothetical protein
MLLRGVVKALTDQGFALPPWWCATEIGNDPNSDNGQ